jgi:hypothetical protein
MSLGAAPSERLLLQPDDVPQGGYTTANLLDSLEHAAAHIKAVVQGAESRDDYLEIFHHFKPVLDEFQLPPSTIDLVQAYKDAQREKFLIDGKRVDGLDFLGEVKRATCSICASQHQRLDAIDHIVGLCSRTVWDGDAFLILRSLFR